MHLHRCSGDRKQFRLKASRRASSMVCNNTLKTTCFRGLHPGRRTTKVCGLNGPRERRGASINARNRWAITSNQLSAAFRAPRFAVQSRRHLCLLPRCRRCARQVVLKGTKHAREDVEEEETKKRMRFCALLHKWKHQAHKTRPTDDDGQGR